MKTPFADSGLPVISADGAATDASAAQSSAAHPTPALTSDSAKRRARGTAAAAAGDWLQNVATATQHASEI